MERPFSIACLALAGVALAQHMKPMFENRDIAEMAAEKLKGFANSRRLMILSCLLQGEHNVGGIAQATSISQPTLSQQLKELRRAGLVQTRKEAKMVWYSLANDGVVLAVHSLEAIFGGNVTPLDFAHLLKLSRDNVSC